MASPPPKKRNAPSTRPDTPSWWRGYQTELFGAAICMFTIFLLIAVLGLWTEVPWLGSLAVLISRMTSYCFGLTTYPLSIALFSLGIHKLAHGNQTPYPIRKKIAINVFLLSLSLLFSFMDIYSVPLPKSIQKHVYHIDQKGPLLSSPKHTVHYLGGIPSYIFCEKIVAKLPTNFPPFAIITVCILITCLALLSLCDYSGPFSKKNKIQVPPTVSTPTKKIQPIPRRKKMVSAPTPLPLSSVKNRLLKRTGSLPPLSLLTPTKPTQYDNIQAHLSSYAKILQETLASFGIEAHVGNIHAGPTILSFEIHPAVGVKIQKIKALESDIALKLQAVSIRILAPIPGKGVVGVEIPSPFPQPVTFYEMQKSYQESPSKMQIPVLLGKNLGGENITADLTKMPHCIIAGATGSGKSVCINTIIMSIIMNTSPEEVRLLMIDPKRVELGAYSDLPHMIAPVVTDPQDAPTALNWLMEKMLQRYTILESLGFRNIIAFNSRLSNEEKENIIKEEIGVEIPKKMPYFVAIIDEFADLIMSTKEDVETPITRIAQMARAVGIHLLLATQRPSREVITGLIKANFPTRIAFKVASRTNSLIILDDVGAETLLGNGDMLFLPPSSSELIRAQGPYISDVDINQVLSFFKDRLPRYIVTSFEELRKKTEEKEQQKAYAAEGLDPLYTEAVNLVTMTGKASTTFLQRKLKIGYARAASLIDELEENGVVGASIGAKPRPVLTSNRFVEKHEIY